MIIRLHPDVKIDLTEGSPFVLELGWNDVWGDDKTRQTQCFLPLNPNDIAGDLPYVLYPFTYDGELILREFVPIGMVGRICKVSLTRRYMSFLTTNLHGKPEWDFAFSWQDLTIINEQMLEQAVALCRPL